MTIEELYIRTLNIVYVIFGYDIPCCNRVVIFDKFCSFSVQILLVFFNTALLICNKSDRYIQFFFFFLGLLCGAGCPVGS